MVRIFHKRQHILMGFISALTMAGLMALFTGCGPGLPKELKNHADTIPDAIKAGQTRIDRDKDKYGGLTNSSEFKGVKRFALKEKWAEKFSLAHEELKRADKLYNNELLPMVKKNKPELASAVKEQIIRINKIIQDAESLSKYPFLRSAAIQKTIKNAENLQALAKKDADAILKIVNGLKTGSFAIANQDFPGLKDKINTRFAPLSNLAEQSRNDLNVVAATYQDHTAGSNADYAAFTDSSSALASSFEKVKIFETEFTKDMDQLYLSYTKVLKDMKVEYFVIIKRESWNENSDYYNPGFATFQRQVNTEAYEALTQENVDTIAAITAGFTGSKFKSNIGSNLWKELAINPAAQWPSRSHNAASFWVEDSNETYFHKYLLEENGETQETEWEKVDESFYEANLEFLGMAILAKPYGVFEKDRLTQAAPPGMAYVGNSKYGEWKQNSSGNSFWSWYGKYALFSTLFFPRPYYYPYNSWNSWNSNYRHSQPYFGKNQKGSQKFGTRGSFIKKSPGFQSSTFAKSGGLKAHTASVRGAGANLRGGGPKSKGK
ncbi:MAG: hypothetical protein ABFR31_10010 [Thermodesulfobacteriota bacterium]